MKTALFSALLFFLIVICSIRYTVKQISIVNDSMKANVGTKVLLGTDTLTVVGYNYLIGDYTLNNTVRIDGIYLQMFKVRDSLICIYRGKDSVWHRDTTGQMQEGILYTDADSSGVEYKIIPKSKF